MLIRVVVRFLYRGRYHTHTLIYKLQIIKSVLN